MVWQGALRRVLHRTPYCDLHSVARPGCAPARIGAQHSSEGASCRRSMLAPAGSSAITRTSCDIASLLRVPKTRPPYPRRALRIARTGGQRCRAKQRRRARLISRSRAPRALRWVCSTSAWPSVHTRREGTRGPTPTIVRSPRRASRAKPHALRAALRVAAHGRPCRPIGGPPGIRLRRCSVTLPGVASRTQPRAWRVIGRPGLCPSLDQPVAHRMPSS